MSDWTISVPYQHRDEPLTVTAGFARHLPADDDREVARQIVLGAMVRGVRTAGELLDALSAMEPHGRRALLDEARAEVGLPSTADADSAAPVPLQTRAFDTRPLTLVRTEGGALVERFADDHLAVEADARRRAAESEARRAQRNVDLAGHEEAERLRREAFRAELPAHLRTLV